MAFMKKYIRHNQGDFNPTSFSNVGSLIWNDQGVLSNFGSATYATIVLGSYKKSDLVEVVISLKTGTSISANGVIGGTAFPNLQFYNSKANIGGSSAYGTYTYSTNEDVVWKIQIQNGTGKIYRKDSSGNFVLDYTFSYSTAISGTVNLGWFQSDRYLTGGTINLKDCYVKVNNELVWTPFYTSDVEGYKTYNIMRMVIKHAVGDYSPKNVLGYKAYNIVDPSWVSGSQTFNYTGALQTYTVPDGVTNVQVDCVGAKGYTASLAAGLGGRVKCNLSVTPGQTLYVWVAKTHSNITTPEYNASDVRTSSADITSTDGLNSRLIVAGGGGDGSQTNFGGGEGGHGGGLIGGSGRGGYGTVATGGTQTAGGTGGTHGAAYGGGSGKGNSGTLGLGGATKAYGAGSGGCGGAGYYGGGGGSMCTVNKVAYVNGVGGAGGSSYTDPTLCSNVSHVQGFQSGDGYVKITYKRRKL